MENTISLEYEGPNNEPNITKKPDFSSKIDKLSLNDLLIISDFDYTLTKRFSSSDEKTRTQYLCGFGFYDHCPDISKSFKAEIEELKNKYIKYENDLSVPFETRDKYTKLLYEEDLKLISKYNIPRNFLPKYLSNTIKNKPFYFRPGVKKFIDFIIEHKILLIIISGGLKDAIETTLKILIGKELPENIKIISNEFIYDQEDKIIDYKKPLIYTFNKSVIMSNRIKTIINEDEIKHKDILFMGDHINDIDAIKDLTPKNKVGIVFDNYFPQYDYLEKYDCVIRDEGTFDVINESLGKMKKI